jgi:hypothetical protein
MYSAQGESNYGVMVTGFPGDRVEGLGLPGSRLVSYQLTFQAQ